MKGGGEVGPTQLELQVAATAAKERLFAALGRLDTRAKTWAHGAVETSVLAGLGLAAGATLWVGFAVIKRRRARARDRAARSTALVRIDPQQTDYLMIHTRRAVPLLAGLVASLTWAWRLRTRSPAGSLRGGVPRLHASHRSSVRDADSLPAEAKWR